MSILVRGSTCKICGKQINDGEDCSKFSSFVSNEVDPLYFFSDCTFHTHCLAGHQDANLLRQWYGEFESNLMSGGKISSVSGVLISSPEYYFSVGFLSSDANSPVARYNFFQCDIRELSSWDGATEMLITLRAALSENVIRGKGIDWVISKLASQLEC